MVCNDIRRNYLLLTLTPAGGGMCLVVSLCVWWCVSGLGVWWHVSGGMCLVVCVWWYVSGGIVPARALVLHAWARMVFFLCFMCNFFISVLFFLFTIFDFCLFARCMYV